MADRKCQEFTRWTLGLVLAAMLTIAGPASAEDLTLRGFGDQIAEDIPALVDQERLLLLGVGALSSWAAYEVENSEAFAAALDRPLVRPVADLGNIYGDIRFLAPAAAVMWLAGDEVGAAGRDLGEALLINGVIVGVLKRVFGRTRPNGGRFSYPSGHTSSAMVAAPIADHHAGRGAGVAAFVLGATTGLGRVEDRKHHLSDVLMGAAIGLAVGSAVVANDKDGDGDKAGVPLVTFRLSF